MKRTLAILLAILTISSTAVGCGKQEVETTPSIETSSDTTQTEETKATPNWDAVDKTNLNGMTINISAYHSGFDYDDYTSDILADAVYDRNRLIESTLNCKIEAYQPEENSETVLMNAINSGDGSIDLANDGHEASGRLMTGGYLLPFNYIETIDMTNPWWDQTAMEDITIHGMAYFGWMDFLFSHYDKMQVLFYNKTLLEQYQLEDPYDLYKNENWTIEKFIEIVESATQDTDGDGEMTENDTFGVRMYMAEGMPMLHASGLRMIQWNDETGTFDLKMVEERYISVLEAITPLYNALGIPKATVGMKDTVSIPNGNLLFEGNDLGSFDGLREAEDDYGLIMYPRYDYSVEGRVLTWGGAPILLPKDIGDDNGDGVDDFDELGIFLEAIGAYTHDVLIDIYMEKNVVGKGLRDERSAEMFYEMINMRSVEFTVYFQTYGFSQTINTQTDILEKSGTGYASAAQSHKARFDKMAERLVGEVVKQMDKLGISY